MKARSKRNSMMLRQSGHPGEPIVTPVVTSPRDAKKWKGGLGEFCRP